MKKNSVEDIKVIESDNIEKFKELLSNTYPFELEMLSILKEENNFLQSYHWIQRGESYAFFIIYRMKMNVLTFGNKSLNMNIKVIGYPCSLSEPGFYTNDEAFFLEYIKKIKGIKLVLNAYKPIQDKGFMVGETLPTCVLSADFASIDDYIGALRSNYRRRIKLAIDKCKAVEMTEVVNNNFDIYELYLNTYNKSDYKLEKLEKGFFVRTDTIKLSFVKNNKALGFVMLKIVEDKLVFMLCGMDYNYETADLYYFMLYKIIEFAINNKCKTIDLGQTSEVTKMKFGALLEKRYFYANHSNYLINHIAKAFKGILEYKYKFPEFRVYREDSNEGTFS